MHDESGRAAPSGGLTDGRRPEASTAAATGTRLPGGGPGDLDRAEAEAAVEAAADAAVEAAGTPVPAPAVGAAAERPADADAAAVCPFLQRDPARGAAVRPIVAPDPANRCVAFGEPLPQSVRQQQLVCLQAGHVDCPRYLRGTLVLRDGLGAWPVARRVPRATLGAIGVLLASALVAVAFVVRNGGLSMPLAAQATSGPTATLVARASVAATSGGSPIATTAGGLTPGPTAVPSPASPAPTPTPTATAGPSPSETMAVSPTPTSSGGPSADRLAVLVSCPSTPDCYVYTIRSGDNLYSIAHWFGVPLESLYRRNPWLRTTTIRAGMKIELPTPTR